MRRSKRSRPRPAKRQAKSKTSEIQRRRLPKDTSVNKDHQKSTEVHKSTKPRPQSTTDLSLSRRRSNELQKGGYVSKMRPTDKPKAHRDAVYRDTLRSRPVKYYRQAKKPTGMQSTETRTEKSTEKSTKSTKILLKPPIKSNYEVDRMVTKADFER